MNVPQSGQGREQVLTVARIIHAAIVAGLVLVFAVFFYLQRLMPTGFPDETARVLRIVGYLTLAAAALGTLFMRGRIAPAGQDENLDRWWTEQMPKAVSIWAVAEGGGLAALVIGWIIGDMTLFAVGAGVALALLFVTRPGRLQASI
ncbi:MAG: hypothetical protein JSU87_14190 [Gemmatimonadota bacterium]|nr:MAG: hypothetical protein JSU87_14190 [Gemmatimonadota bacterium]